MSKNIACDIELNGFLDVLSSLGDSQIDVMVYILKNIDTGTNLFMGTYDEISEACNVSRPTIAKIMKKLQEANFIKKEYQSVWRVNSNVMYNPKHYQVS